LVNVPIPLAWSYYVLMVTVKGVPNPDTGFVMDLKILSRLIDAKVLQKLDHRNINLEVDFMQGKLASTENLAIGIWEELEPEVQSGGAKLHSVRLEETENNIVNILATNKDNCHDRSKTQLRKI